MNRPELRACWLWTLGIGVVAIPLALVLGSGHVASKAGAYISAAFLLPSLLMWELVAPVAGSVIGGLASAAAQVVFLFAIVYLVRRVTEWAKERQSAAGSKSG